MKTENSMQVYLRLLKYVKKYWPAFLVSVVGFAIYAASQTASAKWLEAFIDAVESGQLDQRAMLALAVLGIFFIRGVGTFLGNYGLSYVARYVVHNLRIDLFRHLMLLPSSYYHQNSSGELLAKLTYNVEQVTGAATNALKIAIREGFTVIGLFGYMLYLNWKLTLLFLVVGPVVGVVVGIAARRMRGLSRHVQQSVGDITSSASEAIKGFQVVRIFGATRAETDRFIKVSQHNRRQVMKMVVTQSVTTPMVQMMVAGVIALMTFLAMDPDLIREMSTGQFIAFISAAALMAKPVRSLTEISSMIQQGLAASESVFEVVDTEPEKDIGTYEVERADGALTFKNLSFNYEADGKPILNNISVDIKSGETIALVGKSGSGKSTLAGLLPRFYDATEGEIFLDGHNLQDYTLENLRNQIALVNQQVILFNGTIAENIAYGGMADCSREMIEVAAEAAHVTEFVQQLPDGLDTLVGENGMLLSGGQRQRIAIARAILKDAPILILDEATSALDTESERHIQDALENVMQGRTTLVIAHRLSTIENADRILVMDSGQIIEQGNHSELLQRGGVYANLYKLQFSETTAEPVASQSTDQEQNL
ncbi:ATP-binding cassette, subfamily B, bacterial MsbA [Amphritea japonica ATCC BAA-1530]|uniref:ATP-binding cassette, subfamily B, bacterial MsbA n=2 Tax=Amphritea TaxID=515417 RepID=A0A7R6SR33_9GAMM|nr:lipid A export permease/ATP-binding protein MsbA [Amphritea japonica]BBB24809.1 ATP-binding cassette, subfamily B, bacterial MsbA [Amphritea japonica ATCC BAA-1530]